MLWAFLAALLLTMGLCSAQEPTPAGAPAGQSALQGLETRELTLAECVELALRQNYSVRIGEAAIREAEAGVELARSGKQPRLSAESSYLRIGPQVGFDIPVPGGPPQHIEIVPETTWNVSFSLVQPLYTSGLNEARIRLARLGVDMKQWDYENSRRTVALDVERGYFEVLKLQALQQVAEESLRAAQEHHRVARALMDAGVAPRFDVLRAEVEVANVMQNLMSAQNAVNLAKVALRTVLALEPTVDIVLQEPGESLAYDGSPMEALTQAWENRPEIKQTETAIRLAEANVRLQKATDGLTLSLIGGYDFQKATGFGSDKSWRIGLGASKPLFDGGQARASARQAQAQLEQARLAVGQVRDAIALDVAQAYLAVSDARQRLQTTQATVDQAVEGLRIAGLRYEEGVGTNVEVLDAQVALTAARTNQVNATYDYRVALARLYSAMGHIVPPTGESGGVPQ
jgi:outer membrane protein